jgi:hypothetical protein
VHHGYIRNIIGCGIFWWVIWLVIRSVYLGFLRGLGLLLMVQQTTFTFLGWWVLMILNICHLFPRGWSPYFSWCNGTCQDQQFSLIVNTIRSSNFITLCCPFLGLSVEHLMVHLYHHFFDGLFIEKWICQILIYAPLNTMWTCFQSCVSLAACVW